MTAGLQSVLSLGFEGYFPVGLLIALAFSSLYNFSFNARMIAAGFAASTTLLEFVWFCFSFVFLLFFSSSPDGILFVLFHIFSRVCLGICRVHRVFSHTDLQFKTKHSLLGTSFIKLVFSLKIYVCMWVYSWFGGFFPL